MTVILRPYQEKIITDARRAYAGGARGVLMCMATGAGKTVTASTVVQGASLRRKTIWWLTHRRELINQASQTFYRMGIPHGTIQSGRISDPHALVQVASIQTIIRRLDKLAPPDLIVFDESHHIGAGQWDDVYKAFPDAHKLGLTATPWRLDGTGLGHWYDEMVMGPSMAQLIQEGALTKYKLYAPPAPDLGGVKSIGGDYVKGALAKAMSKPKLVGDAIDHYLELCPGKRAIVFAAGIDNSKEIARQFNERGIRAEHVDGAMTNEERDASVARFERGETLILSNDSLFGEGFDVPAIEAVILLRPTQSLSLYLQMVGRALRPAPGKEYAYLLDHAGNSLIHGLPDDDRDWTLEDREKKKQGAKSEVSVKQCPECFFVYRPAFKCPQCGHVAPIQVRQIEVVDGKLEEVIKQEKKEARQTVGRAKTYEELLVIEKARGYKPGWARKMVQVRGNRK